MFCAAAYRKPSAPLKYAVRGRTDVRWDATVYNGSSMVAKIPHGEKKAGSVANC
jgi:hypothetical protein